MTNLPSGTLTFLFTDIEGSTKLWEQDPAAMKSALARHDAILRERIEAQRGYVFKTVGDAFCAAFPSPHDALDASLEIQRALTAEPWGKAPIKVRAGLHTGIAEERAGDYFGPPLNRVARVMSAGHGGQTLLSQTTQELVRDHLPADVTLRDLGEHRLKDLQRAEHLFQIVAPDLPADFAPLKSLNAVPNNLPVQLTTFIGREKEIAQVKELLNQSRLLTLTGTGGTGKTRLSLQVAAEVLDSFSDGVWLIELAQLSDPALIPQSIASLLEVREMPDRSLTAVLTDYLRGKTILLILDNCEHLIEACAKLAEHLLRNCPQLKILASSREAFGIAGEIPFRVPSLTLPAAQPTPADLERCEAARLFIERAHSVKPNLSVTNQNAPVIAQICQRLDGIPLALELAAARVNVLSVEQIATRLNDRFRLLTGGSRTALPRQQTLRAAIDWSYELLSDAERELLRRLSVFVGGWTFEGAEVVCASEAMDVLDTLSHLVSKSLVVVDDQDRAARYHLLEMIRQYARDKLLDSGEAARLRDHHLNFFARLAKDAARELEGGDMRATVAQLELEHDNLRAALEWALESNPDVALALAIALSVFWGRRGYASEGCRWLSQAVAYAQAAPPLPGEAQRARLALQARANFSWGRLGIQYGARADLIRAQVEEGLRWAEENGDEGLIALGMSTRAIAMIFSSDEIKDAEEIAQKSADMFRQLGDKAGLALALIPLAQASLHSGNFVRARAALTEGLELSRQVRAPWESGMVRFGLGFDAFHREKDFATARQFFQEAIAEFDEMGDKHFSNITLSELAEIARQEKNYAEASARYRQVIRTWQELGHRGGLARCFECVGFIARAQGHAERAARLIGAAQAMREANDLHMTQDERPEYDSELSALRAQLDEATFNAAWNEGRALTMEQATALAMSNDEC